MTMSTNELDVIKTNLLKESCSNPQNVLDAIISSESTKELISWLCLVENIPHEGNEFCLWENINDRKMQNTNLSSRVAVSFIFLNAIRDACREFLDSQSTSSTFVLDGPRTPEPKQRRNRHSSLDLEGPQYSDSFPPLSVSGAKVSAPKKLVGRKKKKTQSQSKNNGAVLNCKLHSNKKNTESPQKRRIRPASAMSLQSSPWSSGLKFSPIVAIHGNISSLPSEDVDEMRRNIPPKDLWGAKESGSLSVTNLNTGSKSSTHKSPAVVTPTNDMRRRDISNTKRPEQKNFNNSSSNLDINTKKSYNSIEKLKVQRLADIYATLLKNYLVPSLALELQLLFRLLCVKNTDDPHAHSDESNNHKQHDGILKRLFSNGQVCRDFSSNVLLQLKNLILHLGNEMIKDLVSFPPLIEHLPKVATGLSSTINLQEKETIFDESNFGLGLGAGNNTAIITLPFDEARDSRHNFRSQEQARIYKNREESRDAFLYQLREFQEIRGTFLHSDQIKRYLDDLDTACQKMIQSINPNNFSWFTNLFCDLLLQIGLVPMGETDKDILNHVGDKDRLQKLHRRFTSKGFQSSKSSQKLILPNKQNDHNRLTATRPETFFTDHQEFFFRFIQSVDSYRFNILLRNRLARLITSLSSTETTRGLEHRIAQLQLLAKFLGMITFSPNWDNVSHGNHSFEYEYIDNKTDSLNDSLPIISLQRVIEDSWRNYRLTIVIPWVVEFLRMSTWDIESQKSSYYQRTLGVLLSIRKGIKNDEIDGKAFCKTTSLFILFHLEILFSEIVGLVESEKLPLYKLPERITQTLDAERDSGFDRLPLVFSKSFLLSSFSQLEGLQKLIIELTSNLRSNGGIGTPKKLKPFSVETDSTVDLSLNDLVCSPISKPISATKRNVFSSSTQKILDKKNFFCVKLIDSFFHQHKDLQHICEFVVDLSLKNIVSSIVTDLVIPSLEKQFQLFNDEQKNKSSIDLECYFSLIRELVQGTEKEVKMVMHDKFRANLKTAIEVLTPSLNVVKVRNIATNIAISNAIQKGDELLVSLIRSESKKIVDSYCEKQRKVMCLQKRDTPVLKTGPKQHQAVQVGYVFSEKDCCELNQFRSLLEQDMNELKTSNQRHPLSPETQGALEKIELRLLDISNTYSDISKNEHWVKIFDATCQVAAILKHCIKIWFMIENDSIVLEQENSVNILRSTRMLTSLGRVGILTSDMVNIGNFICSENNINLLLDSIESSANLSENSSSIEANFGYDSIFHLLLKMVSGRLVQESAVEDTLLKILDHSPSLITSIQKHFLEIHHKSISDYDSWCKGETLGMPRLKFCIVSATRS